MSTCMFCDNPATVRYLCATCDAEVEAMATEMAAEDGAA